LLLLLLELLDEELELELDEMLEGLKKDMGSCDCLDLNESK